MDHAATTPSRAEELRPHRDALVLVLGVLSLLMVLGLLALLVFSARAA